MQTTLSYNSIDLEPQLAVAEALAFRMTQPCNIYVTDTRHMLFCAGSVRLLL